MWENGVKNIGDDRWKVNGNKFEKCFVFELNLIWIKLVFSSVNFSGN